MAITDIQISEELETNAPSIKYSGNEGPKSPEEEMMMADALLKENIDVELIDLRSVRPIDYNSIIDSVKKTNRLVIIEEAWPLASISSEISHHIQRFAFDYLDAPIHRITCEDVPFHYAPTLIKEIIPDVDKAMKAIKAVTYK